MEKPLAPGGTIGILGGGQLGKMSAEAAHRLGYRVRTFDPSPEACAVAVSDAHITAPWDDLDALDRFAEGCDRITLEFENIPPATVAHVARHCPAHPSAEVLSICQHRRREKEFLRGAGIPCAPFEVINDRTGLAAAVARMGHPCVLKTAAFGYDGKGQFKLADDKADLDAAWSHIGSQVAVLEGWVPFDLEVSVIVARTVDGRTATFDPAENLHRNHILHLSLSPARISESLALRARELAVHVAEKLGLVGLLGVELFVKGDQLLVNELAPRPHNSGHQTLECARTSQFEQHIRAVCGLPMGSTDLHSPAAMVNLLGDLWRGGSEPDWSAARDHPGASLHLYGKGKAVPGRKMGHITVLAKDASTAASEAEGLHARLVA
jgi:5-(carboxyamino)imidazole ribonucleotide synthase